MKSNQNQSQKNTQSGDATDHDPSNVDITQLIANLDRQREEALTKSQTLNQNNQSQTLNQNNQSQTLNQRNQIQNLNQSQNQTPTANNVHNSLNVESVSPPSSPPGSPRNVLELGSDSLPSRRNSNSSDEGVQNDNALDEGEVQTVTAAVLPSNPLSSNHHVHRGHHPIHGESNGAVTSDIAGTSDIIPDGLESLVTNMTADLATEMAAAAPSLESLVTNMTADLATEMAAAAPSLDEINETFTLLRDTVQETVASGSTLQLLSEMSMGMTPSLGGPGDGNTALGVGGMAVGGIGVGGGSGYGGVGGGTGLSGDNPSGLRPGTGLIHNQNQAQSREVHPGPHEFHGHDLTDDHDHEHSDIQRLSYIQSQSQAVVQAKFETTPEPANSNRRGSGGSMLVQDINVGRGNRGGESLTSQAGLAGSLVAGGNLSGLNLPNLPNLDPFSLVTDTSPSNASNVILNGTNAPLNYGVNDQVERRRRLRKAKQEQLELQKQKLKQSQSRSQQSAAQQQPGMSSQIQNQGQNQSDSGRLGASSISKPLKYKPAKPGPEALNISDDFGEVDDEFNDTESNLNQGLQGNHGLLGMDDDYHFENESFGANEPNRTQSQSHAQHLDALSNAMASFGANEPNRTQSQSHAQHLDALSNAMDTVTNATNDNPMSLAQPADLSSSRPNETTIAHDRDQDDATNNDADQNTTLNLHVDDHDFQTIQSNASHEQTLNQTQPHSLVLDTNSEQDLDDSVSNFGMNPDMEDEQLLIASPALDLLSDEGGSVSNPGTESRNWSNSNTNSRRPSNVSVGHSQSVSLSHSVPGTGTSNAVSNSVDSGGSVSQSRAVPVVEIDLFSPVKTTSKEGHVGHVVGAIDLFSPDKTNNVTAGDQSANAVGTIDLYSPDKTNNKVENSDPVGKFVVSAPEPGDPGEEDDDGKTVTDPNATILDADTTQIGIHDQTFQVEAADLPIADADVTQIHDQTFISESVLDLITVDAATEAAGIHVPDNRSSAIADSFPSTSNQNLNNLDDSQNQPNLNSTLVDSGKTLQVNYSSLIQNSSSDSQQFIRAKPASSDGDSRLASRSAAGSHSSSSGPGTAAAPNTGTIVTNNAAGADLDKSGTQENFATTESFSESKAHDASALRTIDDATAAASTQNELETVLQTELESSALGLQQITTAATLRPDDFENINSSSSLANANGINGSLSLNSISDPAVPRDHSEGAMDAFEPLIISSSSSNEDNKEVTYMPAGGPGGEDSRKIPTVDSEPSSNKTQSQVESPGAGEGLGGAIESGLDKPDADRAKSGDAAAADSAGEQLHSSSSSEKVVSQTGTDSDEAGKQLGSSTSVETVLNEENLKVRPPGPDGSDDKATAPDDEARADSADAEGSGKDAKTADKPTDNKDKEETVTQGPESEADKSPESSPNKKRSKSPKAGETTFWTKVTTFFGASSGPGASGSKSGQNSSSAGTLVSSESADKNANSESNQSLNDNPSSADQAAASSSTDSDENTSSDNVNKNDATDATQSQSESLTKSKPTSDSDAQVGDGETLHIRQAPLTRAQGSSSSADAGGDLDSSESRLESKEEAQSHGGKTSKEKNSNPTLSSKDKTLSVKSDSSGGHLLHTSQSESGSIAGELSPSHSQLADKVLRTSVTEGADTTSDGVDAEGLNADGNSGDAKPEDAKKSESDAAADDKDASPSGKSVSSSASPPQKSFFANLWPFNIGGSAAASGSTDSPVRNVSVKESDEASADTKTGQAEDQAGENEASSSKSASESKKSVKIQDGESEDTGKDKVTGGEDLDSESGPGKKVDDSLSSEKDSKSKKTEEVEGAPGFPSNSTESPTVAKSSSSKSPVKTFGEAVSGWWSGLIGGLVDDDDDSDSGADSEEVDVDGLGVRSGLPKKPKAAKKKDRKSKSGSSKSKLDSDKSKKGSSSEKDSKTKDSDKDKKGDSEENPEKLSDALSSHPSLKLHFLCQKPPFGEFQNGSNLIVDPAEPTAVFRNTSSTGSANTTQLKLVEFVRKPRQIRVLKSGILYKKRLRKSESHRIWNFFQKLGGAGSAHTVNNIVRAAGERVGGAFLEKLQSKLLTYYHCSCAVLLRDLPSCS